MTRVFLIVLDSFGVGGAEDATKFGDENSNTLLNISRNYKLNTPNLARLGFGYACQESSGEYPIGMEIPKEKLIAKYGFAAEASVEKDTTSGHWEIAGLPVTSEWGHFKPDYPSFPQELVEKILTEAKLNGILGNIAASGTKIIEDLGEEHIKTGYPIFYTSADSNIQIAAHEKHFGLDKLYELCEIAYKYVKPYNIARIIARPFIGETSKEFTRTKNRHDYSVPPFADTVLDKQKAADGNVIGIGKIPDIFANSGITQKVPANSLEGIWNQTIEQAKIAPDNSIIFPNFVDFDMLWGHRRDVKGYGEGLDYFDSRLPEFFKNLKNDDLVIFTADHGCDPTYSGTDHTRENIPVIIYQKNIKPEFIGKRETFADIAQTIAKYLKLDKMNFGKEINLD